MTARKPKPPTPAEQRRARWDWIKTLHPQARPGRWRKPAPAIPAPTARERRVMRDSTRSKRARRDREAMH